MSATTNTHQISSNDNKTQFVRPSKITSLRTRSISPSRAKVRVGASERDAVLQEAEFAKEKIVAAEDQVLKSFKQWIEADEFGKKHASIVSGFRRIDHWEIILKYDQQQVPSEFDQYIRSFSKSYGHELQLATKTTDGVMQTQIIISLQKIYRRKYMKARDFLGYILLLIVLLMMFVRYGVPYLASYSTPYW